jgi:putative ABC transport system ATP-binding protein
LRQSILPLSSAPDVSGAATEKRTVPALEVSAVTKVFGSGPTAITAVDNVSFAANPGEIVLIMGPSGSGKTTLLTMIGALLRPTSGRISLYGQEITGLREGELPAIRRRYVGFIFQSFNLLESLTAQQNVEVALNLRGLSGAAAHRASEGLLAQVGLATRRHAYPKQLSGGERQRVSIARALANEAPLLLADEPTANLDSQNGRQIADMLRDAGKARSVCVVIVSHDTRIQHIADRVLWLEDGRFVPQRPIVS